MLSIEALIRNARWQEAERACRHLLCARPADARLNAFQGICLFRMGDFAAAEPCFMRATVLDPWFVNAGVKRCQCLERLRRYDEALELAREWLAKRPNDPTLGAILRFYGNRPDASRTEAWQVGLRKNRPANFAA